LGVLVVLWLNRNGRGRALFFAFCYFVVLLFPVLGFFTVYFFRYSFVGDHFQYLASIGPLALVGAGLMAGFERLEKGIAFLRPVLVGIIAAGLGVLTGLQSRMYVDNETLWRTTIERNPACWMAYNNLGYEFLQTGRVEEAISLCSRALELHPNDNEAHNNLGIAFARKGNLDLAFHEYREALRINPNYADAHYYLGTVYAKKGELNTAIQEYREALRITPDDMDAHYNLGNALASIGNLDAAIHEFQETLRINPNNPQAQSDLSYWIAFKNRQDKK
jgi:cytochrome c-type biogenesis protein CcmH/NrfG